MFPRWCNGNDKVLHDTVLKILPLHFVAVRLTRVGFIAIRMTRVPRTGLSRRHYLHETTLQRAIRQAALKAKIRKKVTSHTLRHYKIHPCILSFRPAKRCSNFLQENLVFRHPSSGSRLRYPHGTGITRPCRCFNNDDLYPCIKQTRYFGE